jgi:hypothetical protein
VKKIAIAVALATLAACHSERVTGVYTLFWHSEKCHPNIWYKGEPPNAAPACEWKPVNPPPPGVEIH